MTDTTAPVGGWAFPSNARKAHAFDTSLPGGDGMTSLCFRWMLMAVVRPGYRFEAPLEAAPSPSDCAACRKALVKRAEQAA